jgi:hypothetical protein
VVQIIFKLSSQPSKNKYVKTFLNSERQAIMSNVNQSNINHSAIEAALIKLNILNGLINLSI